MKCRDLVQRALGDHLLVLERYDNLRAVLLLVVHRVERVTTDRADRLDEGDDMHNKTRTEQEHAVASDRDG